MHIVSVINYKGEKELKFNWTVTLPPAGEASIDGSNTENPTFNFGQLGRYTVNLLVFEDGGSISKRSSGVYEVTGFAFLEVVPSGTTISYEAGENGSSTITLEINGGKPPYSVDWLTVSATPGTLNPVLSTAGSTATLTVNGGAAGTNGSVTITGRVTDSQVFGEVRNFTIIIGVTVTAPG